MFFKKTLLFAIGVVLLFFGVALSQPSNIYTFTGDVDLGRVDINFVSSGQHYIGGRGDTVYVIRSNGWTLCQKSTDGGQTFLSSVRVNSTSSGLNPSMRVDTVGVVYVAFQHSADIYFSKSTDGGQTFTPAVKVNDDTIPQVGQEKPAIAVNNKGQIFIAWRDQRTAPGELHRAVFASASYDGGLSFTPNVLINDENNPLGGGIDIAVDDSNHVYVAWKPYQIGIFLSRSDDSGYTFPLRTTVTDSPAGIHSLAIGSGKIGLAWEDWRFNQYTLRFSVSTDYGETFSSSVRVDDFDGFPQFPSLVRNDGIFYVAWRASRTNPGSSSENHIYFSYSSNKGQSFAPSADVISVDTNFSLHTSPSLTVNGDGKVFAAWSDSRHDPLFQEIWHIFVATGAPNFIKGDLNLDGIHTSVDVVVEINAAFLGLSFPAPLESADLNCDSLISGADVVLLMNLTFLGAQLPCN
jgi:hypothetical protein